MENKQDHASNEEKVSIEKIINELPKGNHLFLHIAH